MTRRTPQNAPMMIRTLCESSLYAARKMGANIDKNASALAGLLLERYDHATLVQAAKYITQTTSEISRDTRDDHVPPRAESPCNGAQGPEDAPSPSGVEDEFPTGAI